MLTACEHAVLRLDALSALLRVTLRATRHSAYLASEFMNAGGIAALLNARYPRLQHAPGEKTVDGAFCVTLAITSCVVYKCFAEAALSTERASVQCVLALTTMIIRNCLEDDATMSHTIEKVVAKKRK